MNTEDRVAAIVASVLVLLVVIVAIVVIAVDHSSSPPSLPALIPLASGSGVTILEYQGEGIRCIIANGRGTSLVCQVVPTPAPDTSPTKELEA